MNRAYEIDVKDFIKQQARTPKISINDKYITASEYAEHMGMHKITILRQLEKGKIEGAIKIGGRWKIPVKTV